MGRRIIKDRFYSLMVDDVMQSEFVLVGRYSSFAARQRAKEWAREHGVNIIDSYTVKLSQDSYRIVAIT